MFLVVFWLLSAAIPRPIMHVTRVVVHKREHKMVLMGGEKEIKTYQIALGDLVGAKQRQEPPNSGRHLHN